MVDFTYQKGVAHIFLIVILLIAAFFTFLLFSSKKDSLKKDPVSSQEEELANFNPKPFQDVSSDNDNYTAIKYLAREQVLESDQDKKFNPDKLITKAEWVVTLVKLTSVVPDEKVYKNCYLDVGEGDIAAYICYAKEQGWLKGFDSGEDKKSSFHLIPTVRAQQSEGNFNPDNPVKGINAVGSLSRLMNWQDVANSNEDAVNFAKERAIVENVQDNLTKAEAAGVIYKSLATVPLGNSNYSSKLDGQAERYNIEELVDRSDKAQEEYSSLIRSQRQIRNEQLLEMDKALGQKLPTFDIFEPVQNFITAKGSSQKLSSQDVFIYRNSPPHYENKQKTSETTINIRDSAQVYIFLDKDFRIMTKDQRKQQRPTFALDAYYHHFVINGRAVGSVMADLVNFETGVLEYHHTSPRMDFKNLNYMFNIALNGIEAQIGQEIAPPIQSSTSNVAPQEKGPIGCSKFKEILASENCVHFALEREERSLWCARSPDELTKPSGYGDYTKVYKNRAPDYIIDSSLVSDEGFDACLGKTP